MAYTPPESVLDATDADLGRIAERDAVLAGSSLAAAARRMAARLDSKNDSLTSQTMAARQLRELMDRLWELAPEPPPKGDLDALISSREARRAGGAASEN